MDLVISLLPVAAAVWLADIAIRKLASLGFDDDCPYPITVLTLARNAEWTPVAVEKLRRLGLMTIQNEGQGNVLIVSGHMSDLFAQLLLGGGYFISRRGSR